MDTLAPYEVVKSKNSPLNQNFPIINKKNLRSAVDLKTGEDVAIKFAEKYRHFSLEKEYVNYLYLGADGRYSNFSIHFEAIY